MFMFRSANHSQGHKWFTSNKHSAISQKIHQNIVSVTYCTRCGEHSHGAV